MKYLRKHLASPYRLDESVILLDEDLQSLEGSSRWKQLWEENDWYSHDDEEFKEALYLEKHGQELEALYKLNALEKKGYKPSLVLTRKAGIYSELGNQKAARSALQEAVKKDVRNLEARHFLAEILVEDEKFEEARKELDILIRREPDRFEAYLLRARARSASGNLQGARSDLDSYLLYFPGRHDVLYRKGLIEHEHGKYLNAIASFNSALGMSSGEADYYLARGQSYMATGTTVYAEKDLSMALDLDPLNPKAWFSMGQVAEKLGKKQKACDCYGRAQQLGLYEAGNHVERLCR